MNVYEFIIGLNVAAANPNAATAKVSHLFEMADILDMDANSTFDGPFEMDDRTPPDHADHGDAAGLRLSKFQRTLLSAIGRFGAYEFPSGEFHPRFWQVFGVRHTPPWTMATLVDAGLLTPAVETNGYVLYRLSPTAVAALESQS